MRQTYSGHNLLQVSAKTKRSAEALYLIWVAIYSLLEQLDLLHCSAYFIF